MSDELVGFENLPNAFIKKINITNVNSIQDSYEVIVRVHDLLDRSIWSNTDHHFFKLLKVGVFFSTDLNEISSISNGKLDLSSLPYLTKSLMIEPKELGDNNYFELKFRKRLKIDTSNLTVFAFCLINKEDVLSSLGVDLQRDYIGPIKSERIIQSKNIVGTTSVFLRNDGSYWPGPVHEHNGSFMEGSYHTNTPHNPLTRLTIVNTKIKDKREVPQIPNNLEQQTNNIMSKLYVSYNSETDINSIFMVNIKSMLMKHTKHGRFLSRTSEDVVNLLLSKMRFRMISIQRQRIKANYRSTDLRSRKLKSDKIFSKKNILNTQDDENRQVLKKTRLERNGSFDLLPEEIQNTSDYKKVADIEELYFDYGTELRTFQFTDYEMNSKTPGDYQYKVEFQFIDPVDKFLKETTDIMKSDISELTSYLSLFETRTENSPNTDQIVKNYLDHYSYIYQINKTSRLRLTLKYKNLLDPTSTSKSSIFKFLENYRNLYNSFLTSIDYKDKKQKNSRLSVKSKEGTSSRIVVQKTFEEVITPSKNILTFSYLPESSNRKTAIYSKSAFLQKSQEEVEEEFIKEPDFASGQVPPAVQKAVNDVQSAKTAFFSPKQFIDGAKRGAISSTAEAVSSLNSSIVKNVMRNSTKPQAVFRNNSPLPAVTIEPVPEPKQEVEEGNYLESSKILGSNHEFTGYTEQSEDFNRPSIRTKAQTKFDNSFAGLSGGRSFVATLSTIAKTTAEEAKELPNQLKAVINGQSSATKSNFITNSNDFLANPSTKNFFELKNFSVKEVVYVDAFEKDINGNLLLNKPVFKTLMLSDFEKIDKPSLCFLRDYSNEKFNISGAESVQAINSVFVIANEDISSPREQDVSTSGATYAMEDIGYQFMNSNIIRQTNTQINLPAPSASPVPTPVDSTSTASSSQTRSMSRPTRSY